jgi:hypothetical protein
VSPPLWLYLCRSLTATSPDQVSAARSQTVTSAVGEASRRCAKIGAQYVKVQSMRVYVTKGSETLCNGVARVLRTELAGRKERAGCRRISRVELLDRLRE